ncbi:MAG TPA: Nramp family divalent metal transporter [Vicinamibacterales bacterium]|jgi:Mn2+/Fe2+ NRAMP family transporter|nr:Nramp family divalent metal transporter [Vicinamibacterales bacterium]
MATAITHSRSSTGEGLARVPFIGFFTRLVGPAALTAAGMIGAGAVATRLLAGAWFGFDLLWVALYVVPMVVFTLDSASRVGVLTGRGMFEMIRTDIGAWVAWFIFAPTLLVNVIVNMSQMSAMVEGAYGAFGLLPPAGADRGMGLALVTVVLTAVTVAAAVFGGYKRIEKIMTALLLVILVCFIVVAVKGLLDWRTWLSLGSGLVPQIPPDLPVMGTDRTRNGFTQILAIAGQALPPSVLLAYGYLATNSGQRAVDVRAAFWKTVQNLGIIWGLFSVVVIVAGATALHAVYTGAGPSYLGVSHYSQIESIPVAGQVLGPALGFLAPRFFSLGLIAAAFTTLISVSLTMTYFCLDMARRDWRFTKENKLFQLTFALWIAVPALIAPFWQLPALLKAIIAMVGNLVLAPVAVLVILYFVNRSSLGEYRAGAGRNVVLATTALFALALVAYGIRGLFA